VVNRAVSSSATASAWTTWVVRHSACRWPAWQLRRLRLV